MTKVGIYTEVGLTHIYVLCQLTNTSDWLWFVVYSIIVCGWPVVHLVSYYKVFFLTYMEFESVNNGYVYVW